MIGLNDNLYFYISYFCDHSSRIFLPSVGDGLTVHIQLSWLERLSRFPSSVCAWRHAYASPATSLRLHKMIRSYDRPKGRQSLIDTARPQSRLLIGGNLGERSHYRDRGHPDLQFQAAAAQHSSVQKDSELDFTLPALQLIGNMS